MLLNLQLIGSLSTGQGPRPFWTNWTVRSDDVTVTDRPELMDALRAASSASELDLTIPAASFEPSGATSTLDATYYFELVIRNALDLSLNDSASIAVHRQYLPVPEVAVDRNYIEAFRSEEIFVRGTASLPGCITQRVPLSLAWSYDRSDAQLDGATWNTSMLRIAPFTMVGAGRRALRFTATALSNTGEPLSNSAVVQINILRSELFAIIGGGGRRTVHVARPLVSPLSRVAALLP